MKFVINKNLLRNNPYLYLSVILVLCFASVQTKSLNVSNVLDRISSGDLNEKDVLDFYKKDYDASLEYHQFFQPCLAHLINEEKGKSNSLINKWFPGMKNYFTSSYSELEFSEIGVKIKCEFYINKFVSREYKLQKSEEANPLRDSIETCKKEVSKLEKINQDLTSSLNSKIETKSNSMHSFNFKSDEQGPKIEYQDKPNNHLNIGDNKVEFQDKPDKNLFDSLNLKKIKSAVDTKSSSSCNEELQKTRARVNRLEKDNALYEKQIVEKNKLIQIKEEQNNKYQESSTKLKLEIADKEKSLNDCQNRKIEIKASLEKCKVKVGTCGGSSCAECENKLITKIDELTTCEKIKKDFSKKNQDVSDELTTIKIQVSSLDIGKRNVERKLTDCNSEKQSILKKLTKSESQVSKINYKSCAELDECKKSVTEKINEIEILKKTCNRGPAVTSVLVKKGSCEDETQRIRTELNTCNQNQNKYITIIQEKNKTIIKRESDISTLEIEKNNIKTELEKIEKICKDEKDTYEKKISSLEEKISDEKKKYQICRNELKDNKGYKKKWEKCEDNTKKERTKCKEIIEKQKTEIIKIKSEFDRCENENKRFESELKIKISAHETCEKEKDDLLSKIKECTSKLEEETRKFIDFSNTVTIEKERLVQEHQKKCKIQIDILNTRIINYEKEIRNLRLTQDCPVKLTKCTNEKVIIENTLRTKETEFIRIKEEKDTCENELRLIREKFIKIKTSESVCKKTLDETRINWRNCESKKPVPCPTIDESIIFKIRSEYEKCNNELNVFKDDNQKYKETIERLEKIIKEFEEQKNKCVGNCTADLETCQKNVIQIQNKCDEEIRLKIDDINILRKRILTNEEKCSKKIRDLEGNNRKCNRNLKDIKTKADECQKNYIKQIDINKKYVIEITNLKTQLNVCLKRHECNKNAKANSGGVSEKCEKQRTILLKETFTLKEKISKLEEDKKSIYMSSKQIISSMGNKCQKDMDSYETVSEDIETRIKHFYSIKIAIEGEIRSDEILIMTKQKEIKVKTEEKNIVTTEITNIRNDYERIIIEINNIREKIRKSEDIETIRTLTDDIFNKERELKEKNELIIKTSQKEKEILNVIIIIQEQINNYTIIKNIRLQKIKENEENIQKINKILIQIKKTIEIKKTNNQKIGVKIEKFTNVRVMVDARIIALEKEKDNISKELETCNSKLEEEKSTNNLLHMKINKTVSSGLIDINLLMRIFEDNSFTERNCARLNKFKTKFYSVCPMKGHTETKLHIKKHKNTPVESQFPLKASDLKIESQGKIEGLERMKIKSSSEEHSEGGKNEKIESKFPLQNKDLKIESQHPLNGEVLNSGASSSSSSSSSSSGASEKIESQFPLQNKDLKVESQHPLNGEVLNSSASASLSSSSYSSSDNSKVESQFPLRNKDLKIESQGQLSESVLDQSSSSSGHSKYSRNSKMKVESQFPLNDSNQGNQKIDSQEPLDGAKKFRNESEEKAKGQPGLDLNQSLTKLLDAGKN